MAESEEQCWLEINMVRLQRTSMIGYVTVYDVCDIILFFYLLAEVREVT